MNNIDRYCYGPVTANSIEFVDGTLEITVTGSALRESKAVYLGCVYCQIEEDIEGERILLVERVSADDLLSMHSNSCVQAFSQITSNIDRAIERWSSEGYNFYMHHSDIAGKEYIVVAQKLTFR